MRKSRYGSRNKKIKFFALITSFFALTMGFRSEFIFAQPPLGVFQRSEIRPKKSTFQDSIGNLICPKFSPRKIDLGAGSNKAVFAAYYVICGGDPALNGYDLYLVTSNDLSLRDAKFPLTKKQQRAVDRGDFFYFGSFSNIYLIENKSSGIQFSAYREELISDCEVQATNEYLVGKLERNILKTAKKVTGLDVSRSSCGSDSLNTVGFSDQK